MSTIVDVAKKANVSVATVSRVLNNRSLVRASTARRVDAAIAELCYQPNIIARNLRKRESRILLILTPEITSSYFSRIITGITTAAREHGYSAMMCHTNGDKGMEMEFLQLLHKKHADGAILLSSSLSTAALTRYVQQFPIVQCGSFDPATQMKSVCMDYYQAARYAVTALLTWNHTRIALALNQDAHAREYVRGYRDALEDAGAKHIREDWIQYATVDSDFRSGKTIANELLLQSQPPTAIVCMSDLLALGAAQSARAMGIVVPDELSIVGMGDTELCTMFHPHLTSIASPLYAIGWHCVDVLCRLIQQQGDIPNRTVLDFKWIQRESCTRNCRA